MFFYSLLLLLLLPALLAIAAPAPFLLRDLQPGEYRLQSYMGNCKLVLGRDGIYHMWRRKDKQLVMWGDWSISDSVLSLQSRAYPVAFSVYYGFDLKTGKCYQGGTFTIRREKP